MLSLKKKFQGKIWNRKKEVFKKTKGNMKLQISMKNIMLKRKNMKNLEF